MIYEFNNPTPCKTEHGEGYVWYVRDGGTFENDIFCVVLCEGGKVKHYRSDRLTIHHNGTFDIKKINEGV